MAPRWIDRTPERPDRYLDWLLLNRTASGGAAAGWCSVLLQVQIAAGKNPAVHLEALLHELTDRQSGPVPRSVMASPAEIKLIGARIKELKRKTYLPSGDGDPGLSFFVYMRESHVYENGGFAHTPLYRIRFAGPSIAGFDCERAYEVSAPSFKAPQHVGSKVAIGIIDHAIAFANERFRTRVAATGTASSDRSRVRRLWIQDIEHRSPVSPGGIAFGRQLNDGDINRALERSAARTGVINEDAVYADTGAISFERDLHQATAWRAGHGTHVLDIAAGCDPADPEGLRRPILAVQLPEAVTRDTSGVTLASYALQALRQIMHWADTIESSPLPLVVIFSYGVHAGPKDATHLIEREIARLVKHRNRRLPGKPTTVVVPSGNFHRARVTARLSLAPAEKQSIDWLVLPDGGKPGFLEIWTDKSDAGAPVSVTLTPPDGVAGPAVMPPNGRCKVLVEDGRPVCSITYDAEGDIPNSTRSRVLLAVNPTKSFDRRTPIAPSGRWIVTVENTSSRNRDIDLYIQRQDTVPGDEPPGRQSYFDHPDAFGRDEVDGRSGQIDSGDYDQLQHRCPIRHEGSISALATHPGMVVVGAAVAARDKQAPLPARYTSSGPVKSRDGPDFAAVADLGRAQPGTIATGTRSGSSVLLSGTSIAAPQLTRAIADAGGDVRRLKHDLGIGDTSPRDPRTGWKVVGSRVRPDIPPRRRDH